MLCHDTKGHQRHTIRPQSNYKGHGFMFRDLSVSTEVFFLQEASDPLILRAQQSFCIFTCTSYPKIRGAKWSQGRICLLFVLEKNSNYIRVGSSNFACGQISLFSFLLSLSVRV